MQKNSPIAGKKLISKIYDIVIIAAPMTSDQDHTIVFDGFENPDLKFVDDYQTTFATFIQGNLNNAYFGLKSEMSTILSCDPVKTKISSIGKLSSIEGINNNSAKAWKVFSRQKLDDSIIAKMFSHVSLMIDLKLNQENALTDFIF